MDDDLRATVARVRLGPGAIRLRSQRGEADEATFFLASVVAGAVVGWILALI